VRTKDLKNNYKHGVKFSHIIEVSQALAPPSQGPNSFHLTTMSYLVWNLFLLKKIPLEPESSLPGYRQTNEGRPKNSVCSCFERRLLPTFLGQNRNT
jgi:hypothetical protein